MASDPSDEIRRAVQVPVKQVLVEEPVSKKPDVPGKKPQTYRFDDWALI